MEVLIVVLVCLALLGAALVGFPFGILGAFGPVALLLMAILGALLGGLPGAIIGGLFPLLAVLVFVGFCRVAVPVARAAGVKPPDEPRR